MKNLFVIILSAVTIISASSKVAIAIKAKGDVSIIHKGLNTAQALKPGSPLSDQDKIRTGKNGFVAIMYLDDKTVLKMLGNSDMTILGQRSGVKINKSIAVSYTHLRAHET